ncbi:hypothetical protein AB0C96_00300 [Streptomyces sp. NPDC048506]|uniref:hypothetical protein n=1 Tax=Streptomyces sp. NPDC048506 TaxID=3155028 RepID=UPI00341D7CC8
MLELLPGPEGLDATTASAVVRTAAQVGGDAGMAVIARFREDTRLSVQAEFCHCWSSFDARCYAETVLSSTTPDVYVRVSTAEQLAELPRLRHLSRIVLVGPHGLPTEILEHRNLEWLFRSNDPSLRDLSPLDALPHLTTLVLADCPSVTGLVPLRGLGITHLYVHDLAEGMSLAGLDGLAELRHLTLGFAAGVTDVADIPVESALTGLVFTRGAERINLHGLERWPELETLMIEGDVQGAQLASQRDETRLVDLQINSQTALNPVTLVRHRRLKSLTLSRCLLTTGLAPLKDLPELTSLTIANAPEPMDLTPLADLENLIVYTRRGVPPAGTEHFPAERLNPRTD